MRIALISDIHGYLLPLQTVLADIERTDVDQIICLGDVCALGPQPRQALALLKELDCPCVMGNHDYDLLYPDALHESTPWIARVTAWCMEQLRKDDFEHLRSFQPTLDVPLDEEHDLFCFHATPRSRTELLLATTPGVELEDILGERRATIMAGGHTHVPLLRRHKDVLIVNPGSIGLPFEQIPFTGEPRLMPWTEYAIVEWVEGALGVELRRLPVDREIMLRAVSDSGMPN